MYHTTHLSIRKNIPARIRDYQGSERNQMSSILKITPTNNMLILMYHHHLHIIALYHLITYQSTF
mgnify:CR=1 FL=1